MRSGHFVGFWSIWRLISSVRICSSFALDLSTVSIRIVQNLFRLRTGYGTPSRWGSLVARVSSLHSELAAKLTLNAAQELTTLQVIDDDLSPDKQCLSSTNARVDERYTHGNHSCVGSRPTTLVIVRRRKRDLVKYEQRAVIIHVATTYYNGMVGQTSLS